MGLIRKGGVARVLSVIDGNLYWRIGPTVPIAVAKLHRHGFALAWGKILGASRRLRSHHSLRSSGRLKGVVSCSNFRPLLLCPGATVMCGIGWIFIVFLVAFIGIIICHACGWCRSDLSPVQYPIINVHDGWLWEAIIHTHTHTLHKHTLARTTHTAMKSGWR